MSSYDLGEGGRKALLLLLASLAASYGVLPVSALGPSIPRSSTEAETEIKDVFVIGSVKDVDGNLLSDVEVTVLSSGNTRVTQTHTKSSGIYSFYLDQESSYNLEFRKRGYEFRSVSINVPTADGTVYVPDTVLDYSLELLMSAVSIDVDASETIEIPLTIVNKGFEDEPCVVDVFKPSGWSAGLYSGDLKVTGFTVAPSESKAFTLKVEIPYGSTEQENVILVVLGWLRHEVLITINVVEAELELLATQYSILEAAPGETVIYSLSITNPLDEKTAFEFALNLPGGWEGHVSGSNGAKLVGVTLDPDEVVQLELTLEVPSYIGAGTYEVLLTATSDLIEDQLVLGVNVSGDKPAVLTAKYPILEVAPEGSVAYGVKVVSPLNEEAVFEFALDVPSGWRGEVLGPDGSKLIGVTLEPNEIFEIAVTVEAPSDADAGIYDVRLSATSGLLKDELILEAKVSKGTPDIRLSTDTPFLDVYAGSEAAFNLEVENRGAAEGVVDLQVEGLPEGFSYRIEDTAGNIVSAIFLGAEETRTLGLAVKVSPKTEPMAASFSASATSGDSSDVLELGVNVLGWYELDYVTENFYTEVTVGETVFFELVVENDGYSIVNNVGTSIIDVPEDFEASVTPDLVSALEPGDAVTFTVEIEVPADIDAGDYYVVLQSFSDQVEGDERPLHLGVMQRGEVAYLGFVLIAIIVGGLIFVYWRFGRR